MIKNITTYYLLIFTSVLLSAQTTSFKAITNKTELKVGEKIGLSFVLSIDGNNNMKNMKLPDFKNLQVAGRSTSNNFSITQGKTLREYVETIILIPQKAGKITIAPATVIIGNKVIKSNSVVLNVKSSSTEESENHFIEKGKIAFMEINLSKNEAYPNEPIQAVIKLYSKSYDALRRRSDLEVPGISGFQVKKINRNTTKRDFKQEIINNQVYVSEEIEAYSILPQQTGKITIPPFKIRIAIPLDFFDEKIVLLKTPEKTIQIKNLPSPIPKSFSGAIGEFKFNTFLEKETVKTNESINYEVELIGKGNLSGIKLPKIKLSDQIEVYPAKIRKNIQAIGQGQVGKIIDSYVLVPQYGGNFDIPEMSLTFFNPETAKYKTIKTDKKSIKVKGKAKVNSPDKSKEKKENQNIEQEKSDSTIIEIKSPKTNLDNMVFNKPKNINIDSTEKKHGYYWWLILPISILGLLLLFRKTQNNKVKRLVLSDSSLKKNLSNMKLSAKQSDAHEFYSQANILLNNVICYAEQIEKNYTLPEGKEVLISKTTEDFAQNWENLNISTQNKRYSQDNKTSDLLKEYAKYDLLIKELLKSTK